MSERLTYWKQRARDAEWRIKSYEDRIESMQRWGERAYVESRYFAERCSVLYGVAMAHGATHDELTNPVPFPAERSNETPPPVGPSPDDPTNVDLRREEPT